MRANEGLSCVTSVSLLGLFPVHMNTGRYAIVLFGALIILGVACVNIWRGYISSLAYASLRCGEGK